MRLCGATGRHAPYLRIGLSGRSRWRWLQLEAGFVRGSRVLTLSLQTWLSDASERGNLRRKAFVRFKAAPGGPYPPGKRGCAWRSSDGRPCTWERGHSPMVIGFVNTRTGERVPGATSTRMHSWAVTGRLPKNAVVLIEPRRRNGGVSA